MEETNAEIDEEKIGEKNREDDVTDDNATVDNKSIGNSNNVASDNVSSSEGDGMEQQEHGTAEAKNDAAALNEDNKDSNKEVKEDTAESVADIDATHSDNQEESDVTSDAKNNQPMEVKPSVDKPDSDLIQFLNRTILREMHKWRRRFGIEVTLEEEDAALAGHVSMELDDLTDTDVRELRRMRKRLARMNFEEILQEIYK